jgi:hypothetical protein
MSWVVMAMDFCSNIGWRSVSHLDDSLANPALTDQIAPLSPTADFSGFCGSCHMAVGVRHNPRRAQVASAA